MCEPFQTSQKTDFCVNLDELKKMETSPPKKQSMQKAAIETLLASMRETLSQQGNNRDVFVAIMDTEYTGENILKNFAPNVAIVIANLATAQILDERDFNIKPFQDSEWSTERIGSFWDKYASPKQYMEEIMAKDTGKHLRDVMDEFVEFLKKWNEQTHDALVLAFDHPEADVTWLSFYLNLCGYPTLHMLFGSFRPIVSIYWYSVGLSLTPLEHWLDVKDRIGRFNSLESVYLKFGVPWRNHGSKCHMALADARRVFGNLAEIDTLLRCNHHFGPSNCFHMSSSFLLKNMSITNQQQATQEPENKLD